MAATLSLFPGLADELGGFPERVKLYPQLRYMGSKFRLLPWIHNILRQLPFASALDAFSGSGCVSYLLKAMGKRVVANDFLDFAHHISVATVENRHFQLSEQHSRMLLSDNPKRLDFIERTFAGVFFTREELRLLDRLWSNLDDLPTRFHRSLAIAAMVRACVKRQPRGVFTVAGDHGRYDDGRRDLRIGLQEQFLECVSAYNAVVFDNNKDNEATKGDALQADLPATDLVYMDPPYVPRADDNCYIKRYHFLEGLASYWRSPDTSILMHTKVRKIPKRYTPFSYRRTANDAFDAMFRRFRESILVLSYSSNGYPDLDSLLQLMRRYKSDVTVFERPHRYHFGTHAGVADDRANVKEYLLVGV